MFFFFLLFLCHSNRIHANNNTHAHFHTLEELFNLGQVTHLDAIAAQFRQDPDWEHGGLPIHLTELDETTPNDIESQQISARTHTVKNGHAFRTRDLHPYRIDVTGVHQQTEHHIFLVRHGKA
jgi:hypothetical protein